LLELPLQQQREMATILLTIRTADSESELGFLPAKASKGRAQLYNGALVQTIHATIRHIRFFST